MLELKDFDENRNSSRFVHLTALSDDKPGEVEDEFIPPRKIKPIAIQSGDKECTFTLEMVPNKFVNKVLRIVVKSKLSKMEKLDFMVAMTF